jgi:DNA-binding LacI/PurR family transcriptional regulator
VNSGELYILVDDKDLVRMIKLCKSKQLVPGKDVGIISYNDSPFKEIIEGGITTISTDFNQMGQSVIEMIFDNKTRHLENPSKLIHRNSF